ncbi:putative inner membrane protein [Cedecea neteri]|uniref:Putative inner membrane protein n=1 Tax=Cedecea neteri TaxID=158822 RepID=A0A2X3J4S9_9ENTR|nr:putative inner membrane protein [Cedecea neteri]
MTWHTFKQQYLITFWKPMPAVIAAGILSTYYFGITGTFWAVTGEFTPLGRPAPAADGHSRRRMGLLQADSPRR